MNSRERQACISTSSDWLSWMLIARGEPYVVGRAAAEGMKAHIEPSMLEVEAEPLHQGETELALRLDGKVPRDRQRRRLTRLPFDRSADKLRQSASEIVEERVDHGGAAVRLVFVE